MRIAIFTFSYAPLMTGISAVVHDRIVYLLKQGHAVHLVHPEVKSDGENVSIGMYGLAELRALGSFSSNTFPTTKNPFQPLWPEAASYRKWNDSELISDFKPDVILVDEAAGLFGASSIGLAGYRRAVGTEYARRHGIPTVNLLHGDWKSYAEYYVGKRVTAMGWPLIKYWMKDFVCAYDINISPSIYMRQRYDDLYRGRLEHLYTHGVNCVDYSPENIRFNPVPEHDGPLIIFTGRTAYEKNVFQLLKSFEAVHRQRPDALLAILGRGPLLKKLRLLAAREFGKAVHIPGAVFGNELKGWYARADVYWTASTTENYSMGILEALASGTPVVTVAAGGNIEQVEHGKSGFHCRANEPEDMARLTLDIFADTELKLKLSQGARHRGHELSNERSVERLLGRIREHVGIPYRSDSFERKAA